MFVLLIPIIALILSFIFTMLIPFEVTEYTLESDKIDRSITIALIADLHCTTYGNEQYRLVQAIKDGQPDLILFAGDIFRSHSDRTPANILIAECAKIAPTYFVAGNHERANPEYRRLIEEVWENGGIVLADEFLQLDINGNGVILAGAVDAWTFKHRHYDELSDIDSYKIMLTHYPMDFEHYTDFDLMVAGHAHGGQVRIPLIVPNGLFSPDQGIFPKYTGGLYEINNDLSLIVSRGLSKKDAAMFRVFNRPELVFIKITELS
jgi:hypothetical protein